MHPGNAIFIPANSRICGFLRPNLRFPRDERTDTECDGAAVAEIAHTAATAESDETTRSISGREFVLYDVPPARAQSGRVSWSIGRSAREWWGPLGWKCVARRTKFASGREDSAGGRSELESVISFVEDSARCVFRQ